jgi:hypothetical protein
VNLTRYLLAVLLLAGCSAQRTVSATFVHVQKKTVISTNADNDVAIVAIFFQSSTNPAMSKLIESLTPAVQHRP